MVANHSTNGVVISLAPKCEEEKCKVSDENLNTATSESTSKSSKSSGSNPTSKNYSNYSSPRKSSPRSSSVLKGLLLNSKSKKAKSPTPKTKKEVSTVPPKSETTKKEKAEFSNGSKKNGKQSNENKKSQSNDSKKKNIEVTEKKETGTDNKKDADSSCTDQNTAACASTSLGAVKKDKSQLKHLNSLPRKRDDSDSDENVNNYNRRENKSDDKTNIKYSKKQSHITFANGTYIEETKDNSYNKKPNIKSETLYEIRTTESSFSLSNSSIPSSFYPHTIGRENEFKENDDLKSRQKRRPLPKVERTHVAPHLKVYLLNSLAINSVPVKVNDINIRLIKRSLSYSSKLSLEYIEQSSSPPPSPSPKDPYEEYLRRARRNSCGSSFFESTVEFAASGDDTLARDRSHSLDRIYENYNNWIEGSSSRYRSYDFNFGENLYDSKSFDRFERSRSFHRINSFETRGQFYERGVKWKHSGMKRMTPPDEHERKIIIEFCHLLEKSKQLFNGLRELPQYGHKQWQSYFGRTFDVYTKLWKFQQQHRLILDTRYGLKRWQIGEIASKIGQLYYHFYLRTSETAYLREAFSFYYAIRGRSYYTKANREDKCELMVKKLRYYARFIVVAILLKKSKLIKELLRELDRQIIEYGTTYDPDDQIEWTVVLEEVRAFIVAEPGTAVVHPDNQSVILTISGRINNMTIPPIERTQQMYLSLQDAIIIGSGSHQVKFSELTIDMFRILQNLEREPSWSGAESSEDSPHFRSGSSSRPSLIHKGILDVGLRPENPHKYLLFKPSPSQVLIYLASSCNDLPVNGVLLIYISADGYHPQQNKHPDDYGYDIGGLITTSKSDIYKECNKDTKMVPKYKEQQILYPGDLQPFTRKPLFIIVDSDNSYAFQHIPRIFGQPIIILMSPLELPSSMGDHRDQGSLFTLFLHNPIAGLCNTCEIYTIVMPLWDKCIGLLDAFMKEATRLITRIRIDPIYYAFLGDEFLRVILLRYIFCECTLRLHRSFRGGPNLPRAIPPLPEDLFEHRELVAIVLDIAGLLGVGNHFRDYQQQAVAASGPLPSKE